MAGMVRAMDNRATTWLLAFALVAVVCAATGCDKPSAETPRVATPLEDGLTAESILASMRAAYQSAPGYRDKGLLYLSYRLHGRLIQEQQPWQVVFQRPGKLAADWYNARIRCDGSRLGCFVYDIDTANLDNQWLSLPTGGEVPLDALLADPIARQFVAGHSELPLAVEGALARTELVPPVMGWLQGTARWNLLDQPEMTVRLDDATVDGRRCHHLRLHQGDATADLWIDAEAWLVRQMTLPAGLLDPAVRQSTEVADLQFFARFHECQWVPETAPGSDPVFEVTAPAAAVPVRHFVSLPEEFPSDLIGEPIPPLGLEWLEGSAEADFSHPPPARVLVWLPGLMDAGFVTELMACQRATASTRWEVILNDEHLAAAGTPRVWHGDVAAALQALQPGWNAAFDENLAGMKAMKFQAAASAAVIDINGTVQYAQDLVGPDWKEKLQAAVARVSAGEALAHEMRADYEAYLETYQRRRAMVAVGSSADALVERPALKVIPLQPVWSSAEATHPGNVAVTSSGGLVVLDGWRSVVELDAAGKVTGRHELELPAGAAVSRLRPIRLDGKPAWIAWAVLGQALFVLNEEWKLVQTITAEDADGDRVLDAAFAASADSETDQLVVAFDKSGLFRLDLTGLQRETIDAGRWDEVVVAGDVLAGLRDGRAWLIQPGQSPQELGQATQVTGLGVRPQVANTTQQVSSGGNGLPQRTSSGTAGLVAIGLGNHQCWVLQELLAETSRTGREGQIGPQLFDSQIDPLAVHESGWIAVADSQGSVAVFDRQLVPQGKLEFTGLSGLAWSGPAGQPLLVLARPGEVVAIRPGSQTGE